MKAWLKLIRIKHWLKNALVLFPAVFSGTIFAPTVALQCLAAFLSFSLAASAIYIINDVNDADADRANPAKCTRPIASGAIKKHPALVVSAIFMVASIALDIIAADMWVTIGLLVLYIALNIGYSLGLKNHPIIDIAILASGYILRVLFGGSFCGINVSSWLFLTILSLSVFLALGKRLGELKCNGSVSRKSLERYPTAFLSKNMYVYLGMGLVFYSLWTFERIGGFSVSLDISTFMLILGIPLTMLVCLRYSFDIESESCDGDPMEVVLSDKWLIVLFLVWLALMIEGLYLPIAI